MSNDGATPNSSHMPAAQQRVSLANRGAHVNSSTPTSGASLPERDSSESFEVLPSDRQESLRQTVSLERLPVATGDLEEVVTNLWKLLYAKPHDFSSLYALHDVWRNINGRRAKTSLLEKFHFLWIYMLLAVTWKLQDWKISVLVDWWPLAHQEEVAFLQAHMRKCLCVPRCLYLSNLR